MCYKTGKAFYDATIRLNGRNYGRAQILRYLFLQKDVGYNNDPSEECFCRETENAFDADSIFPGRTGVMPFRIDFTDGWASYAATCKRVYDSFASEKEAMEFVENVVRGTRYGGYANQLYQVEVS